MSRFGDFLCFLGKDHYILQCSWIIVLFFICFGINYTNAAGFNQAEYLKHLDGYEITIPSRVTREGDHVSFSLIPEHSVRRRSADSIHSNDNDNIFHYKVKVENQDLLLQLKPNYKLTSPNFVIERKKNRFKNVTDSTFRRLDESYSSCHYYGEIINQSDSRVALGVCNGLHGFLHTNSIQYFIEPLHKDLINEQGHHRHVIYRRSALPVNLDPVLASHLHKRSAEDDSCGVEDTLQADRQRERWQNFHREKRKAPIRRKRSVSTERYVETLVVVDPKMVEYHASEHLETYVLTIMNMVATMFHDASVGNSINIVLVRIVIMEENDEDLVITHHADNTLKSFCKFQKKINFKDDNHPNHHDVAILLTRHDICSRVNEPCSTLGLAQVSGMCQPHRSCNINEDTGLALAYTVTHELGHNFGMHHDGYSNGCEDPPGKQLYIMSPSLVADSLAKSWSNCSKISITKFIDRDWGYCLDDEPARHQYKFPVLPAGTMYDADHQCRLQYGTDDTEICTSKEDVCSNLWCRINNRCSTHLEAAAEGTICGTNKWCYEGKCVQIGDRPEAINGEWGEWSSWTGCTRTCSAGVSHSQRHCDNPQPSHGGKYCLGERKRYRICNTEDCPEGSASFNQVQCEEFNYVPYKNGLYEWEHVPTTEAPCQLHCKPKNQFFSVLLKDIVTDGTRCTAGTRNMCISGRCRHIGCDYMIDSKAIEDRCGICHGDGSTCTTVKSKYTETQGLGYVQAAVIPVGARNIRVEEVAAANNFLALQNDKGEYYLNGHWFIQWSGDYKIAGTTVHYKRAGNMESVTAQGPLKEPLHVMLLLQSKNPGVTFEYTVPKENISEARVPEFTWNYLPWTHCTSSCGGGTQRSEIACTEIEAGIVEDNYCSGMPKPDDKQKVCNEHLCPARWWFGPWQHCSVTCGDDGVHQRTVICVRSLGPDEQIALDDEACKGQEKPKEFEPCHKKDPCAGSSPWIAGEWSSCNENPCGLKYRSVSCKDPAIGCHKNEIPVSEQACSNLTCGHWVTEDWVECTRSCGEGIQYRKVYCEDGIQCDPSKEPPSEQNCNLKPCPTLSPTTSTAVPNIKTTSLTHLDVGSPVHNSDILGSTETHQTNSQEEAYETEHLPVVNGVVRDDSTTETQKIMADLSRAANSTEKTTTDENREHDTHTNVDGDEHENVVSEDRVNNTIHTGSGAGVEHVVEGGTEIKPTTSSIVEARGVEESEPIRGLNVESDSMEEDDTSHVGNEEQISNHDPTHHKHIHNHGMNLGVMEETDVQERNQDQDKEVVDTKMSKSASKGDSDITTQSSLRENMKTIRTTQPIDNSSHLTDNNVSEEHDKEYTLPDKTEKVDKPAVPHLKELPSLESLPPMPDLDKLPPLPNKELPPLPDINKLPPLSSKEMPPLPDMGQLPPLPDKDLHLPPLPDTDNLPHLTDTELPALPDKDKLSPLPDKKLPPLPDLDIVPHASKTEKEIVPTSDGLSMANPNSYPVFKDKDLPPLPDKDKLAPLPDLKELPPLPDLPHLPDKNKLSPLPDSKTDIETVGTELENKDIILDSNVDNDHISENKHIKDNGDSHDVVLEDTSVDKLNESDIPGHFGSDLVKIWSAESEERNYTWVTSDWSECSRYCGSGVRTRSVHCIDGETGNQEEERNCDINFKPNPTSECNTQTCLEWVNSDWGRCSASCGESVQSRIVYCPRELSCDQKSKPIDKRRCVVPKCVKWVSGQWSRCTKTCGGGEQFRLIQCVNTTSQQFAVGCDIDRKPEEKQDCNLDACPEHKAAALTVGCEHNEMSSVVCRALKRMHQCNNRFVALKCCKTCGASKHNKNRPKGSALR